jgi:hypothetical protein
MGRFRVPSPTPSVGSDAPIPETLQDGLPKSQISERLPSEAPTEVEQPTTKAQRVLYIGNLHPRAKLGDLCDLFKPFGGKNIVIRTSRGCGVLPISDEEMGPDDRCYATVNIAGIEETQQAIREYHGSKAPIVEGIPIIVTPNPVDLPEVAATVKRYFGPPSGAEEKRTGGRTKRLAVQKTELVIEGSSESGSLAGPSRSAKSNSRYNPMA